MWRQNFQIKWEDLEYWHEYKNTCIRKYVAEINCFPSFPFPLSLILVGVNTSRSLEYQLYFPSIVLHTEPVVICVFMRYPWKGAKKRCISYHLWSTSPMQPVIKGIWLGDSFTSALETWPTVSLLQTTFFIDCCFLTFVLLPCFSASPINYQITDLLP